MICYNFTSSDLQNNSFFSDIIVLQVLLRDFTDMFSDFRTKSDLRLIQVKLNLQQIKLNFGKAVNF